MKFKTTLIAIVILLSSATSTAASVKVEGVRFEKSVEFKNTTMVLKGYGLLRYMVFIKAYVGALYLHDAWGSDDVLGPVAKRLELEYFHSISKEDFAKATRKKIMDDVTAEEAARLEERIDRLSSIYRDVTPGDRYALTFIPGVGTELALNGESLGTIPGNDFARAVFSIWIGPNPIDPEFRDSLLGTL